MSLVEPQNDRVARDQPADAAIETMVRQLRDFESLLRQAISAGGSLAMAMAAASEAEGLSATVGHQIFAAIANANLSVSTALTGAAKGHRLLEELAGRLGYDTLGYGDVQKDPQVWFPSTASATDVAV